jgi:hypothetical protein
MKTSFGTNTITQRLLTAICLGLVLPFGMARAHADDIYVGNIPNQIVRIDPSGNTSVFGTSSVTDPAGLALDGNGNLYVAAWLRVEKFDAGGNRTVFASGLANAFGVAVNSLGGVYVADGNRILKYNASGQSALFAVLPASVPPDQVRPVLAFDGGGNLFAAYNGLIQKVDANGNTSLFATGPGLPAGLAFNAAGDLFVSDSLSTITRYDSTGHGTVFASGLGLPYGIAFDSSGYLYAALDRDGVIERFDPSGHGTIFASGLNYPGFLAAQAIPEPSLEALLACGVCALWIRRILPVAPVVAVRGRASTPIGGSADCRQSDGNDAGRESQPSPNHGMTLPRSS